MYLAQNMNVIRYNIYVIRNDIQYIFHTSLSRYLKSMAQIIYRSGG